MYTNFTKRGYDIVSTHSRLKAAGFILKSIMFTFQSFNTQPPEGGWFLFKNTSGSMLFQHTAA